MDEKDKKIEILEALVKENRTFRKEIMDIVKWLVIGAVIVVTIVSISYNVQTLIYFMSPSDFSITSQSTSTNENKNINTNINRNEFTVNDKEQERR